MLESAGRPKGAKDTRGVVWASRQPGATQRAQGGAGTTGSGLRDQTGITVTTVLTGPTTEVNGLSWDAIGQTLRRLYAQVLAAVSDEKVNQCGASWGSVAVPCGDEGPS